MAVHRAKISDIHILKKHSRHKELLYPALRLPDLADNPLAFPGNPFQRILNALFQLCIRLGRPDSAQIF